MEYYVHHVPGRLRVCIPEIRRNTARAAEVNRLLEIYGVDHVKVNHLTGSVVVRFDPALTDADELLALLKAQDLFDAEQAITCDEKIQRASNKAASKFGRAVFGYAVGKALESSGFPLLAALI
jgi:predicted sugar kinase